MFANSLSPAQIFNTIMSTNGHEMEATGPPLNDVTMGSDQMTATRNEEAHALARDRGWVEPQALDYTAYIAPSGEGDWAHNAERYEWKEEYGDVGPPSEALEAQLFRSEFLNRQGLKFDK